MNGRESELTYRDVATVLALLDGWGRGRIHFRNGEFEVDAFVAETSGTPASARTLNISSPSVGLFRAALVGTVAGETIGEGTIIGHVVALGRSTPVTSEAAGRLVEVLVGDGEFVEYGQPVAVIAP